MITKQEELLDAADEWVEEENEEAGENESFEKLLADSHFEEFKTNEMVKGKVVRIEKDFVIVDTGHKSIGQIQMDEFMGIDGKVSVNEGDEIDVYIDKFEDDRGMMILSKHKADMMKAWDQIQAATERDEVIEGKIISRVKGGLAVDIGVKAFLPGSQVDLRPVRDLNKLLGQTYKFKVIKFNKKRGNIVLSRRALLEKDRETLKKKTLDQIQNGKILAGIVKNITDYGAFIDLGGIDGLLHITDMSWGRISHPSELFQVGDDINVKILNYDEEKQRVSLGLKQILPDPWQKAAENYNVDQKVKGRIVSIADYGAFVELEDGIEGLIHVSEMSWNRRNKTPAKLVEIGQEVEVVILDISPENKRISLGMKQIMPNPWLEIAKKYDIGQEITGKIRNITDFGIFVGIEEGIDGLIHISDISWTERVKHPSELFKKSQEIKAKVLNIDIDNERFSLGIKQLEEDPWIKVVEDHPEGSKGSGKIVRVSDFGVFVDLGNGIDGLIHLSELAEEKVEDPTKEFKEGDEIEFVVQSIDSGERKISLSRKRLLTDDASQNVEDYNKKIDKTPKSAMGEALQKAQQEKENKESPLPEASEEAPEEVSENEVNT